MLDFVDSHHHFIDTESNEFQQGFLKSVVLGGGDVRYLPDDYRKDVVDVLLASSRRDDGGDDVDAASSTGNGAATAKQTTTSVRLVGSVHVEAMPDDGLAEAEWVSSLSSTTTSGTSSTVLSIVASCDLTSPDVERELRALKKNELVKGVRWILDYVGCDNDEDDDPVGGKISGDNGGIPHVATHVGTKRHTDFHPDYLRCGGKDCGSGRDKSTVLPEFERGFGALARYGYSFDLQCAPEQLLAAATLCERHPDVLVCIDHLGKPRCWQTDNPSEMIAKTTDADNVMEFWRTGMRAMSKLPHVYCKISMLGFAVPGWIACSEKRKLVKQLVLEVVGMFGPDRCMVALNWHIDAAIADSDGLHEKGPDPQQFLEQCAWFFEDLTDRDRQRLFCDTARQFYKILTSEYA